MRVLVVLALLVACGVCHPLCTPDQWEGFQHELAGYYTQAQHGVVLESSSVHYDFTNSRSARFLQVTIDGQQKFFSIIVKYIGGKGTKYIVDQQDHSCKLNDLKTPFKKICLPGNAVKSGEFSYGPAQTFVCSAYNVRTESQHNNVVVYDVKDVFIPVEESMYGTVNMPFGSYEAIQNIRFADITPGIHDDSVFDVPSECIDDNEHLSTIEKLVARPLIFGL